VQAARALAARRVVPENAREALARELSLDEGSPQRSRVVADLAFHHAIVAGAGNARITRAYEDIEAEILLCLGQLVREPATVRLLAAEHEQIMIAIGSGRQATAEAAIRHHLEDASARFITRAAAGGGDLFAN
jgi:DNA-binding GntR family transcriptional regulator